MDEYRHAIPRKTPPRPVRKIKRDCANDFLLTTEYRKETTIDAVAVESIIKDLNYANHNAKSSLKF